MNADERFTGRGVTIAFLDSGFYAHDDLTKTRKPDRGPYYSIFYAEDDPHHWRQPTSLAGTA